MVVPKNPIVKRNFLSGEGIPPWKPEKKWNKEKVQEEILAMLKRGESIKSGDVSANHIGLYAAACRFFDGYANAVESLGLNYSDFGRRVKWSEEEIVDEIRKLAKSGKPLHYKWVKENRNSLFNAAANHLGGWKKALEYAGVVYRDGNERMEWSEEKIIRIINKMYRDGERMDACYVRDNGSLPPNRA